MLNNEPIVTLREFCKREERSAQTFVVLVRRFPSEARRPLYAENREISLDDRPGKVVKKGLKWLFGAHALCLQCMVLSLSLSGSPQGNGSFSPCTRRSLASISSVACAADRRSHRGSAEIEVIIEASRQSGTREGNDVNVVVPLAGGQEGGQVEDRAQG